MAKGPFHFKRFSIEQDGAAMKVGTDGIVLGCWTPIRGARRVLDAGAGNGYVGIMLLQRMEPNSTLIGVEIEHNAAAQCQDNYERQPFPMQTHAWQGRLQDAADDKPEWAGTIDLMVSNPPFYRDKPKSPIAARNFARHDDSLKMGEVVASAARLLRPGGRLCAIWPQDREGEWADWAHGHGFSIMQTVQVQTMRHLAPKRILSEWVKGEYDGPEATSTLTLEGTATLDFTDQYLQYVRPYLKGT